MKKLSLLLAVFCLISGPAFAQIQLDLNSTKRPVLLLNQDFPMLYKPTKLIIGKENKFSIKADPKSYVSLLISSSNDGTAMFKGQKLKLGEDIQIIEGTVPDNGLLELSFTLPDNKDLNEKVFYFEAIVSKDTNYTNPMKAKTMGASGRETNDNSVMAALPSKDKSGVGFTPALPGAPVQMYQTMQMIQDMKQQAAEGKDSDETYKDDGLLYQSPLIRNLAAPDLNRPKQ
jgi:hypothetical protein